MIPRLIKKSLIKDSRGYFVEQFNINKLIDHFGEVWPKNDDERDYWRNGIQQISESYSNARTFRGFHFQLLPKMNKIMRVIKGSAHILCINLTDEIHPIHYFYLSEVKSDSECAFYLHVPANHAVGFVTWDNTIMQYFHNTPHNESQTRSIHFQSIIDKYDALATYNVFSGVRHFESLDISKKDRNAPSLQEWLKTEEWKTLV